MAISVWSIPAWARRSSPDRIPGFDILVVRSTKVTGSVFGAGDRLALVIRAGAGTNTIDTAAAAARGVLVANVPGRNSAAVAELTMGLLLAIDRRIPDNVADLRAGRWNKKTYSKAAGLLGSTLGIVGLGSIGLGVAERAAAFGDQGPDPGEARSLRRTSRHVRPSSASPCVPRSRSWSPPPTSSPCTCRPRRRRGIWSTRRSSATCAPARSCSTPPEATSSTRPPCSQALDAGTVRAGLDVYGDEPGTGTAEWKSALAQHPNVVGTHHIGASTQQAQLATAAGVVEIVDAFTAGEARNCVNLEPRRLGSVTLTVRHLDRLGVLARVLDLLSGARLNVEHMENRVFRGGEAAVASIDVAGSIPDGLLDQIGAVENVLGVSAAPFAGSSDAVTWRPGGSAPMSVVRPFRAGSCVRTYAVQNVSQMLDALPAAERLAALHAGRGPPAGIDPEAYDESAVALFVYRLRRGDDEHVGVVGEVRAEAFVDGQVRGHEAVQPDRVDALVDLFTSAAVRSELVALLHRPGPGVADAMAETLPQPNR